MLETFVRNRILSSRGCEAAAAIQKSARFRGILDCRVGLRPPRNDDLAFCAKVSRMRCACEGRGDVRCPASGRPQSGAAVSGPPRNPPCLCVSAVKKKRPRGRFRSRPCRCARSYPTMASVRIAGSTFKPELPGGTGQRHRAAHRGCATPIPWPSCRPAVCETRRNPQKTPLHGVVPRGWPARRCGQAGSNAAISLRKTSAKRSSLAAPTPNTAANSSRVAGRRAAMSISVLSEKIT